MSLPIKSKLVLELDHPIYYKSGWRWMKVFSWYVSTYLEHNIAFMSVCLERLDGTLLKWTFFPHVFRRCWYCLVHQQQQQSLCGLCGPTLPPSKRSLSQLRFSCCCCCSAAVVEEGGCGVGYRQLRDSFLRWIVAMDEGSGGWTQLSRRLQV